MNDKRMGKWKLGVLLLVLVTAGLFGYVVWQGTLSKQDRATYDKAQAIADKLNSYTLKNQKVPTSLGEAGATNVPSSVTYTKKSSTTYQFCVTFKAANIDVAADVQQKAVRAALGGGLGGSSSSGANYTSSTLYISTNHKAGKQCQTVKISTFNINDYLPLNGSSGSSNYFNYNSGSSSSSSGLYDYGSGSTTSSGLYNQ
jgi:hypothetical protein